MHRYLCFANRIFRLITLFYMVSFCVYAVYIRYWKMDDGSRAKRAKNTRVGGVVFVTKY
jgi:hypothetical protein